jgi:hypothetical protein
MYLVAKKSREADRQGRTVITTSNTPHIHPDEGLALAEAQRLAAANPSFEFIVFKAVSITRPTAAPLETIAL